MEWPEDFEETDPQHRHVSHLFLVHPGDQITPHGTPELAAAAEKTLTLRGDEGTGWCMAWKACFWARLGQGDRAYRLLQNLIRPVDPAIIGLKSPNTQGGGSYPNFFCAHPPFQIDGNFGGTTAIIEMLLQSHGTETLESGETLPVIQLLPALPPTWSEGSFRGLRARGGIEIDLEWKEGKPTNCTIRSSRATTILLRIGTEVHSLDLEENGSISLTSEEL
jgi:alpha-L-fucosidase 2